MAVRLGKQQVLMIAPMLNYEEVLTASKRLPSLNRLPVFNPFVNIGCQGSEVSQCNPFIGPEI